MTPPVDLEFCATALRTITNDIARTRAQPDPAADLAALIGDLRRLNTETSAKMRAALTACYPNIRWTAAEAGEAICPANQMTWIYDPIDGAYHYLQGMPLWSSSLALVQGAQTLAAFVYDPALDEMFLASEGGPAKLNGDDLRVSGKPSLSTAVIGTAIPPFVAVKLDEFQLALTTLAAVTPQTFAVRAMASASLQLAYVAAGRLDAYWEVGSDAEDWLAGALLVCSAGGHVVDLAGRLFGLQSHGIIAGPEPLVARVSGLLGSPNAHELI